MPKSYRIRTQVGINKKIDVNLEQDFEFLEILSLKLAQSELYVRQCSDYGVVVGRVSINNGFGIPNAKLSIFIPITAEDETNPIISSIYPYKTVDDINEDGYKYNLLPYKPSYPGHSATGSFPDLEDVLINPTAIEIYDKYYKFTVTTNDSGDFMIFGVPVGSQTLVMNVDLSDIGPFSLSPQDLIRLGIATETQVNGTRFKTSENINILPQIITISKDVIVEPLWGDEDLCQASITRTDFDLTNELQVEIKPTAIFMGSLLSTPETQAQKRSCKIKKQVGNQCSLISGPGQIKSIRQTIQQDNNGMPILEEFEFENDGNVIDENGTWLLDVPMNLDYVITNEFGEQVFSNDQQKGIPTKAKYRFKIKWNQAPDLGAPFKRGYFLVPNIKEYGWIQSDKDPKDFEINSQLSNQNFSVQIPNNVNSININIPNPNAGRCVLKIKNIINFTNYSFSINGVVQTKKNNINVINNDNIQINVVGNPNDTISFSVEFESLGKFQLESSYSFSLSWDDYVNPNEAIKCEDTFYEMRYNKVYTVSQLIDQYRKGFSNPKFIGIKNITDETCESTANPFPTNDAQYKSSILYLLFSFFILIMRPTLFILLIVSHIVSFLLKYLFPFLIPSIFVVFFLVISICKLINGAINLFGGKELTCPDFSDLGNLFNNIATLWKKLIIRLPNLTYPDCDICDCIDEDAKNYEGDPFASQIKIQPPSGFLYNFTNFGDYKDIQTNTGNYLCCPTNDDCNTDNWNDDPEICNAKVQAIQAAAAGVGSPDYAYGGTNVVDPNNSVLPTQGWVSTSLPIAERINLFNAKSKYFLDTSAGESANRIRVTFNPTTNPITNESKCHKDNVIMIVVKKEILSNFTAGQLLSFQDPNLSEDLNYINLVTGSTVSGQTNIQVQYANHQVPSFINKIQNYVVNISGKTNTTLNFPMDIEYFQVITGMTLNSVKILSQINNNQVFSNSFFGKVFQQPSVMNKIRITSQFGLFINYWDIDEYIGLPSGSEAPKFPYEFIDDWQNLGVLILNRGVDPNTPKFDIEYGLGKLFGKGETDIKIKGSYYPNIPIQNSYQCVRHNQITGNTDTDVLNQYLYFPSFNKFQINQTKFSAFSTNLHHYYVNLDSTTYSEIPVYLPPYATLSNNGNYKCGRGIIDGGFYGIEIENDRLNVDDEMNEWVSTPNQIGTNWTNTGNPRKPNNQWQSHGYRKNEKVEGCSYAHLSYWGINQKTGGNYPRAYGAQGIYVSRKYSSNLKLKVSYDSQSRYVMRSDRLPTSTYDFVVGQNNMALQQNTGLSFFLFSEQGDVTQLPYIGGGGYTSDDNGDNVTGTTEPGFVNSVLASFTCGEDNASLVPFGCYKYDEQQKTIVLDTPGCFFKNPGNVEYFKNNCYQMVTKPIVSLFVDFQSLSEWIARTKIMFGVCQGVFSHLFTNSWINGTLLAFSFKNVRLFDRNNQPYNKTCEDTLYFHRPTNNFYYRSSPYNQITKRFIGKNAPKPILGSYFGGNMKNLLFPTTIMDLGPRDEISKFLSQGLSQDYEGYILNRFNSTTFNDIDEILNLFIISRLANTNFLEQLLGSDGANIFSYFTRERKVTSYYASPYNYNVRNKNMVDSDYAQLISINSELGIVPFDTESYPSDPNTTQQETIYYNGSKKGSEAVIGIFFSSNTQLRDFITPKRIIYNDNLPVNKLQCAFGILPVKDQEVPFYQWGIQGNDATPNIFGNQRNHWYTVGVNDLDDFHKYKYQSLDRLTSQSRFFRTKNPNKTSFYKGYIYSVDQNGVISIDPQDSYINNISPPPAVNTNVITAGNPFYFYFGLNRGSSAMDRFIQKWVDTDQLVD